MNLRIATPRDGDANSLLAERLSRYRHRDDVQLFPESLTTERMSFRQFTEADEGPYAAMRARPAVIRHLPGGVDRASQSRQVTADLFARFAANWREHGFGPWAVESRASGVLMGHCGLLYVPQFDEVELLFFFDEVHLGQGHATEGAKASLKVAFETLGSSRVIAMATIENLASRRVLEKVGFVFEREDEYRGLRVAYYGLNRE